MRNVCALVALALLGSPALAGEWVCISDGVLAKIEQEGLKVAWPGKTTGVVCDRTTGEVFLAIPGLGIWRSADKGANFERADGKAVGGRCETGYTLIPDPAGKRLACFMLDGSSGMTLDGGKTWLPIKNIGRGWDWGCVHWTEGEPKTLFARTHENRDIAAVSQDGGKTWKDLGGQGFGALGIFSESILVASRGKEPKWSGIHRSTDGGQTWQKVFDASPIGSMAVLKGVGHWLTSDEGILVSADQGKTWVRIGELAGAIWGPYFGKDENHFVVIDRKGFQETTDGGKTWNQIAPFPPTFAKDYNTRGWFLNFAWDPLGKVCYVARMGQPAYKCEY
jgi:photosystem II stability/assembly factor-like uncharacterized protein